MAEGLPKFQVVEYDATSSSEELPSGNEAGCSYVISSRHLSPPRVPQSYNSDKGGANTALYQRASSGSDWRDSFSSESDTSPELPPPPPPSLNPPRPPPEKRRKLVKKRHRRDRGERPSPSRKLARTNYAETADQPAPVCQQETQPQRPPDREVVPDALACQPGPPSTGRSRKYAVGESEMPNDLKEFLRKVDHFFTRKHSLARQGMYVSETTMVKSLERIYGEFYSS